MECGNAAAQPGLGVFGEESEARVGAEDFAGDGLGARIGVNADEVEFSFMPERSHAVAIPVPVPSSRKRPPDLRPTERRPVRGDPAL